MCCRRVSTQCTRLRALDVSFNQLTRLDHLGHSVDLRDLKAQGNHIAFVCSLERCARMLYHMSLVCLVFASLCTHTRIAIRVSCLRCTELESISLSDNPLSVDALLKSNIGRLPRLQHLRLVCNLAVCVSCVVAALLTHLPRAFETLPRAAGEVATIGRRSERTVGALFAAPRFDG